VETGDSHSEAPEQKIPAGTIIAGRYRVIKTLGTGGMGSVYLAADSVLGDEKVAIKVLHANFVHDETQLARFMREVQLMRKVNHRNVVRTFDVGTEGYTYFTMEYVNGIQLETLIADTNISRDELVSYLVQICEALRAIHAAGIIHRDLKPANILVLKDGTIRVTDFGVARPEVSNLTGHDEIVGSVCYIAPEIWLGKKITHSADLYALGIILYEMLTGTVPFDGTSPAMLMRAHLDRAPRPPKEIEPSVPAWLNKLTLKLLAKSPSDRPRDAKEVIEYLKLHASEGRGTHKAESAQPFFEELESHTQVITGDSVFARRADTVSRERKSFFKALFKAKSTTSTSGFSNPSSRLHDFFSRLTAGLALIAIIFFAVGVLQYAIALVFPQIGTQLNESELMSRADDYARLSIGQTLALLLPQILLHLLQLSAPVLLLGAAMGAPNYALRFLVRAYLVLFGAFVGLIFYFLSGTSNINPLALFSAATTARDQIAAIALLSPSTTVYEQIGLGLGLVQNAAGVAPLFQSPAAFACFLIFASFLAYSVQDTLRRIFGSANRYSWFLLLGLVLANFLEGMLISGATTPEWKEYFQLSLRLSPQMLALGALNWILVFSLAFLAAMRGGAREGKRRQSRKTRRN